MTVKFKDRTPEVEHFHLALKVAGMDFNYVAADLVYQIHEKVKQTGGKGTLDDIVKIKIAWEKKWDEYKKKNQ